MSRSNVVSIALTLLCFFACGVSRVKADIISGPIVNPANGHTYYLLSENNWLDSEAEAQSLGGHLATVNNAAENAWIFETFSTYGGVVEVSGSDSMMRRKKAISFGLAARLQGMSIGIPMSQIMRETKTMLTCGARMLIALESLQCGMT